MPQMSPLMWASLFIFFSFLMMTSTTKNYYNYMVEIPSNPSDTIKSSNTNLMTWKW